MDVVIVDSTAEALAALGSWGGEAAVMAGGTALSPAIRAGRRSPRAVVHIGRVAALARIDPAAGVRIGAAATLRHIATAAGLASHDALRRAAALVGSWQIQGVGTLGGNIAEASPVSDLLPPLVVHGAALTLESARAGRRTLPVETLVEGKSARAPDEIILFADLEPPPARTADHFEKLTRRGGMEYSILSLALRLTVADDGETVDDIRIAVGAMGPATVRGRAAEDVLRGRRLSAPLVREAAEALLAATAPETDVRASAAYRRAVLPRLFARAVPACAARAAARTVSAPGPL